MSDEKKRSHWDDLAEDLGAETPTEPPTAAVEPPKPRDVSPPSRRKSSPRQPAPPTDWSSLADGLGLSASAQEEVAEDAAPPILMAEAADAVVEDGVGEGADGTSTAQTPADGTSGSEETPVKKRRRRRGRGRGRGRSTLQRDEGGNEDPERSESNEQDTGEVVESGAVEAEVLAERQQDDASGKSTGVVEENGEGEEKRRKPRRRRGRRRRSKTTDVEPDAKSDASLTPSDEDDENLESAEMLTGYADGQSGADEDNEVGEELADEDQPTRKSSGGSQRQIPTWEEAIGIIVEVNMEAREKAGKDSSSAPRRGGRSRGSRGGGQKR